MNLPTMTTKSPLCVVSLGLALIAMQPSAASQVTSSHEHTTTADVPNVDLAAAHASLVVIGHETFDPVHGRAIRVLEVLRGTAPSDVLPMPSGVHLGLHEDVPQEARLLFLDAVRIGPSTTWRVSQYPGVALDAEGDRPARLRAMLQSFDLLGRGIPGSAHAVLSFAESWRIADAELASIALRALTRREDVLVREHPLGISKRFSALLENDALAPNVRAEAACALATVAPDIARERIESLLSTGKADQLGNRFGPLLVGITGIDARSALATRVAGFLDRAAPGAPGEILTCLKTMRTSAAQRTFDSLLEDPRVQRAYRTHLLRK
ncbi:MAG: hypothetical protein H6832_14815 [Planctomycetes bacterium]|nr:hypothetical protein [Planctomycetota bacterium]